jgi:hypothetical protein
MQNEYGSCQKCKKPLEKIKCPKENYLRKVMWFDLLVWWKDLWLVLMAFLWSNTVDNLEKEKYIITCNNKNCSNYLKDCSNNEEKSNS